MAKQKGPAKKGERKYKPKKKPGIMGKMSFRPKGERKYEIEEEYPNMSKGLNQKKKKRNYS